MKWLKQIEYYFFPLRKPDLEVEALVKKCEENKLRPKDISEPVLSFVECVKNNRKRFILHTRYFDGCWYKLTLYDRITADLWSLVLDRSEYRRFDVTYRKPYVASKPEFITDEEAWYIFWELKKVYEGYAEVIQKRKALVAERYKRDEGKRIEAERSRLKSIYCKNMEEV